MTQSATTHEEKSSRSYWGFVVWPVAVVVFYVLSQGPAHFAATKGIIPYKVLKVYYPLDDALLAASLWRPYCMYLHLWIPEIYDKNGYNLRTQGPEGTVPLPPIPEPPPPVTP